MYAQNIKQQIRKLVADNIIEVEKQLQVFACACALLHAPVLCCRCCMRLCSAVADNIIEVEKQLQVLHAPVLCWTTELKHCHSALTKPLRTRL
jgi:hypothetical protein